MLETLDYTIRIGSTPTFLYFDSNIIDLVISCTDHSNNVMQSDITDSLFQLKSKKLLFVY